MVEFPGSERAELPSLGLRELSRVRLGEPPGRVGDVMAGRERLRAPLGG
jgi:hypothetical protein